MSAEGTSVTFPYRREVDGMLQSYPLEGTLVVFNDSAVSEFALHEGAALSGNWPDGNDQILIEKIIAEILEVEVGDRVTIREHDYTLCGIYDKSALPEKGEFLTPTIILPIPVKSTTNTHTHYFPARAQRMPALSVLPPTALRQA